MFSWIGRSVSSSGVKETLLALTGLTLVAYLVLHLLGNLTLYTKGADGLNGYAASLESLGPLLLLAEIALLILFVVHVGLALRITRNKNMARAAPDPAQPNPDIRATGSLILPITGLVVLAFLIGHVIDLRKPELAPGVGDLGAALINRLSSPVGASLYLIGVLALGIHMRHAIPRAIRTLWPNPSRWSPLLRGLEATLPLLLTLGFASFPAYFLLIRTSGPG